MTENGNVESLLKEAVELLATEELKAKEMVAKAEQFQRESAECRLRQENLLGRIHGLAASQGQTAEQAINKYRPGVAPAASPPPAPSAEPVAQLAGDQGPAYVNP
jgi:hypothetical protein